MWKALTTFSFFFILNFKIESKQFRTWFIIHKLSTYNVWSKAKIDVRTYVIVSGLRLRNAISNQFFHRHKLCLSKNMKKTNILMFIKKTTENYENEMKILNGKSHLQSLLWIFHIESNVSLRSPRKKNTIFVVCVVIYIFGIVSVFI